MRIVSLLPSATEIAGALGLREQLVGRSHECDYPAGVDALPVLTASILAHGLTPKQIDQAVHEAQLEGRPIYTVDAAALAALKPDLILTQGVCSVCAVTPETFADDLRMSPLAAEVETPILSLGATDFEGVLADIETVAVAAGIDARGRELSESLRTRWAALSKASAGGPRPSVFFLEWPDPPWYAGHWVPEQIDAAGGRDCFAQPGATSRPLPWEEIAAADPDAIVVGACGCDLATNFGYAEQLGAHPVAGKLRALESGRCWAVDANSYFSRPGPRLVEGAELIATLLRGELDPGSPMATALGARSSS